MKRKKIMLADPGVPELSTEGSGAAACLFDGYLLLDIYENNKWICRHATDIKTGEYETYDVILGKWEHTQLFNATRKVRYEWYYEIMESAYPISDTDKRIILKNIRPRYYFWRQKNAYDRIIAIEQSYAAEMREAKEMRRRERISALMSLFRMHGEVEVEPGGTIRQHRGIYDEEPDIDQIKPFLRQWQREIRKRMSKEDYSRAEKSAALRQKNIEELIANKNRRVLDGLAEDFMDITDLLQEAI